MDEAVTRIRKSFAVFARLPGEQIPLAEAALLVAAEEYPDLDVGSYLSAIDALADDVREEVDNAEDARAAGSVLAAFLHEREGFRGNDADYYDPKNSFLNEVLDRRRGIPITLSILYMEMARRLGLAVQGIGVPGHFMVQLVDAGTYVDPFSGEVDLRESDCARRVSALFENSLQFDRSMLAPQSSRQILTRLLTNLREIYRRQQDDPHSLGALDRLLLLNPDAAHLYRDRALVLQRLGEYRRALRDVEQVRRLQPSLRRSDRFRSWRRQVQEMAARLN